MGDCGEAGPKGGHLLLVRASYEACASGVHVGAGGCSKLTASAHCDRTDPQARQRSKDQGLPTVLLRPLQWRHTLRKPREPSTTLTTSSLENSAHMICFVHSFISPCAPPPSKVLEWLDYGVDERPTFLTLYFEGVDTQGHYYGPNSVFPPPQFAALALTSSVCVSHMISRTPILDGGGAGHRSGRRGSR